MSSQTEKLDEPIVRRKLSDQVFDRLREMIASGQLAPGDYLPSERELMKKFGVGRPAVREALQLMQTRGLIQISHGERSRVNKLTAGAAFQQVDEIAKMLLSSEPSNLAHLKQLRRIFELGVVKLAAQKCTPQDISDLRNLVAEQRGNIGDPRAFIQSDIRFHARIAEISANPLLEAVSEAMLKWIFEYHASLLHWSGREETTLLEHEKIVDYLENDDAEGASHMMEDHLDRADPLYKKVSGGSR